MYETVTVDEALAHGKRTITYPSVLIFFATTGLTIFLILQMNLPGWLVVFSFAVGLASSWLYWSVMAARWRIWAFDNVRNVHELKKRAIKANLIWADGAFWEKTELRSTAQEEKWAALQEKFKQPDIFHDDYSIPTETRIYYSKIMATGTLLFGIGMAGGGAYFFTGGDSPILACVFVLGGLVFIFMGYRHLTNHNPQIILSNNGVALTDNVFYSWADISNEDTRIVRHGKSSTTYFVFTLAGNETKIDIGALGIATHQFEKLLRTYRGRFNNRMAH